MNLLKVLSLSLLFFINSSFKYESPSNNDNNSENKENIQIKLQAFDAYVDSFYDCLNFNSLNRKVLKEGLKGYFYLKGTEMLTNDKYLTLVDFSLASNKKRVYVIDMEKKKVVKNSLIAHGRNSGGLFAKEFSNESDSKMSSIGFYVTGRIYNGKYDYSLKIHGMEYSNDNAYERGVVIHSAEYANEDFMKDNGNVLGRSFGCPALPEDGYKQFVDLIKDGSCFFIYGKERRYLSKSSYLKNYHFINHFYSYFQES